MRRSFTFLLLIVPLSMLGCQQAAESVSDAAGETSEAVADQVSSGVETASEAASDIADEVADTVADAADAVTSTAADVAAAADNVADEVAEAATDAAEVAADVAAGIADEWDTPENQLPAAVHAAAADLGTVSLELGSPDLTSGIPGDGDLTVDQIAAWIRNPENHRTIDPQLPLGLAAAAANIKGLDRNPLTLAKVELGRQLYFDGRLSSDGSISCASCHHPDEGFGRHTQFGIGVDDQQGGRNSPVSYNRIVSDLQFWDGRAASLEEQAAGPIANPIEMGNTHEAALATISGIEGYRLQFAYVFPGKGITMEGVTDAIASFERALVSLPTKYDYWERVKAIESDWGDEIGDLEEEDPEQYAEYQVAMAGSADLSDSAKRGRDLFFSERVGCTACHAGANFSDELYHNLGVGMEADEPDLGRFVVSGEDKDKGAFKTPTVRNVSLSAPYMHDGTQATLLEVVEWYSKGGHANPHLSDKVKKLDLNDQEKQDLVAFMDEGLTSGFTPVETARLP